MKKSLLLIGILLSMTIPGLCQSDTISYWHVYFNNKLLNEFSVTTEDPVVNLKFSDLHKGSKLTVKYYKDTPCEKCSSFLTVLDIKNKVIITVKGVGTFNNMDLIVNKLIKYHNNTKKSSFKFYYLNLQ